MQCHTHTETDLATFARILVRQRREAEKNKRSDNYGGVRGGADLCGDFRMYHCARNHYRSDSTRKVFQLV